MRDVAFVLTKRTLFTLFQCCFWTVYVSNCIALFTNSAIHSNWSLPPSLQCLRYMNLSRDTALDGAFALTKRTCFPPAVRD